MTPLFPGSCVITNGEALATLKGLPENKFDGLFCDPPYGLSFMGKKWDYDVPSVEVWREALRVLKPGAYLLAFGGSRTFHRIACGIEDAGFELRDCLTWLYGKGFPKSQNIALAIDKAARATTELAKQWDGYGTALKPAYEPIILARKPLEGTTAQNVAKWGVGGLAIDACRIEAEPRPDFGNTNEEKRRNVFGFGLRSHSRTGDTTTSGRWPANLVLDEDAAALLDASVAPTKSTPYPANDASGAVLPMSKRTAGGYTDEGGPSRFFYCAKVSTKEREFGCDSLPKNSAGEVTEREDESAGLDSPRAGAGRTGGARNHHPTLKPIALTRWLARLILPPTEGATLLVPYSGAGSEMIGALQAGWPAVFGIEGEADYVEIANARIAAWTEKVA